MFFIQIGQVSGAAEVSAGISSTALFGLPISNLNDVGVREDSRVRCMRLGNNLTVVTMQHEELDGPRFDDRMHPLQHRSFFNGFDAPAAGDESRINSTNSTEVSHWGKTSTVSFGSGSAFGGADVLSYASGSALAGGGQRVQLGGDAGGQSTGSAKSSPLGVYDKAGPSLFGGQAAMLSSGSVLSAVGGGGSGGASIGGGGGVGGALNAATAERNAAIVVNGVATDATIHEDPSAHWGHLGMFGGVNIELRPAVKAHLTEAIYGLAEPRQEVDEVPCPYTTMYYHNSLAAIAKETFYLGDDHERLAYEAYQPPVGSGGGVVDHSASVAAAPPPTSAASCSGTRNSITSVSSRTGSPSMQAFGASSGGVTFQQVPISSPSPPATAGLALPSAVERELRALETKLEDVKAQSIVIVVGSDMGYSSTTLLRVAALVSEVSTFLGYPNNEQYVRTVVRYMRKLMLEGNVSFLEQSRERMPQSSNATERFDSLLRGETADFSERVSREEGLYARLPVYSSVLLGDRLVSETSPAFTTESLRENGQGRGEVWVSDKYLVQLVAAAYYSIPTLVGDQITPREWRIRRLEEGLSKFGVNRANVTRPNTRAFMARYFKMMGEALPVASGSGAEIRIGGSSGNGGSSGGTVVPKRDKASEKYNASIYLEYFDELLLMCDSNVQIIDDNDSSTDSEELGGDGGMGADHQRNNVDAFATDSPVVQNLQPVRLTTMSVGGSMVGVGSRDARLSSTYYDRRQSSIGSQGLAEGGLYVGRTSSLGRRSQPLLVDETLKEAMAGRNLRASMRIASSNTDKVRTPQGLQPTVLSLKRSMKLARESRKKIQNVIPKCNAYHDPCRFIRSVRSSEIHGFSPNLDTLERPDVLFIAVIEGVLLRGYDRRDAVLQLDFFRFGSESDDVLRQGADYENCPQGYSIAFLYAGVTPTDMDTDDEEKVEEATNNLKQMVLFDDRSMNEVYRETMMKFQSDVALAQWLTSPTVESYGIPGLIHFACIDRRFNMCVTANFDAAIRNSVDPDVKIGNRMLHEILAHNISKAHELLALGFSEGLWGHLGVQFFYCVGLMPSESRLLVQQQQQQQQSVIGSSNLVSRAGSPETAHPLQYNRRAVGGGYGAGGTARVGGGYSPSRGGQHQQHSSRMLQRTNKNFGRTHFTQSVYVDPQTLAALSNASFATTPTVYSTTKDNNRPSIDTLQGRGTLLFPERTKLPLRVVQNLLYRPYLIPDKAEAPVLEFYGLFIGAMSPSEVCDAVEMLWGKIFE